MLIDLGKSIAELETAIKPTPNDIDVAYTSELAYLKKSSTCCRKAAHESMIGKTLENGQTHVVIGRA